MLTRFVSRYLTVFALAGAATLVPGCVDQAAAPTPAVADPATPPATDDAQPRIVTQITTREGAQITFYNERAIGDDPVISLEIKSPDATPVLDALLAQQPTALELFVAVQPDRAAPDELVREHGKIAEHDASYGAAPRALKAEGVAGTNLVEPFSCAGNFAGWQASFNAWAPVLDHRTTGTLNINSGLNVGYTPKFYFDVCRVTSSNFAYLARTERRSSDTAAWSIVNDGSPLGLNQRYRFFRNTFTCSSFQYRLHVESVGGSYFRGAAYDDEFSCQIQL